MLNVRFNLSKFRFLRDHKYAMKIFYSFVQVVFVGPYEHHSNMLPWKVTGAKVCCITFPIGHNRESIIWHFCLWLFFSLHVILLHPG